MMDDIVFICLSTYRDCTYVLIAQIKVRTVYEDYQYNRSIGSGDDQYSFEREEH